MDHSQTVCEHDYDKLEITLPIKYVKLSTKITQGLSKVIVEMINRSEHTKIQLNFPLLQISQVESRESDSNLTIIIEFKPLKLTNLRSRIDVHTKDCNLCSIELRASLFRTRRSKRSFLGFVRNTDLSEALNQATTQEALQDSVINNQIQTITNRINKDGLVLERDTNLVENLSVELCSTYTELKDFELKEKINNLANSVVSTILDITRQCSDAGIPAEINSQVLNGLCLTAFPTETCNKIDSNFRLLVQCSVAGVYQLRDKYVIDLALTIPTGLMTPYMASEIFSIPVIKNSTATEISIKPRSFFVKLLSSNSHTVVRDCKNIHGYSLCSINDFDMTLNNCIDAIVSNKSSSNCISSSVKLSKTENCFVKRLNQGFLISSDFPIKTYSSGSIIGFTKSHFAHSGIFVLADSRNEVTRFTCNSLELETKQIDFNVSLKVELQPGFDIQDTMNSNYDNQHWGKISQLQNDLRYAKNLINQPLHIRNISLLNTSQRTWINNNRNHYYTLIALIAVSLILVIIISYKLYSCFTQSRRTLLPIPSVEIPLIRTFEA